MKLITTITMNLHSILTDHHHPLPHLRKRTIHPESSSFHKTSDSQRLPSVYLGRVVQLSCRSIPLQTHINFLASAVLPHFQTCKVYESRKT